MNLSLIFRNVAMVIVDSAVWKDALRNAYIDPVTGRMNTPTRKLIKAMPGQLNGLSVAVPCSVFQELRTIEFHQAIIQKTLLTNLPFIQMLFKSSRFFFFPKYLYNSDFSYLDWLKLKILWYWICWRFIMNFCFGDQDMFRSFFETWGLWRLLIWFCVKKSLSLPTSVINFDLFIDLKFYNDTDLPSMQVFSWNSLKFKWPDSNFRFLLNWIW